MPDATTVGDSMLTVVPENRVEWYDERYCPINQIFIQQVTVCYSIQRILIKKAIKFLSLVLIKVGYAKMLIMPLGTRYKLINK